MDRIKGTQMGQRKAHAGFSLVELIIVIAIMAILIAVLAPQYLKYVEKTKTNKDADSFGKLVEIVEYEIIDQNTNLTSDQVVVTWNTSGGSAATFSVSGVDSTFLGEVCQSVNGVSTDNTLVCRSRSFKGAGSVSVTFRCDSSGDSWTRVSSGVFQSYVDY